MRNHQGSNPEGAPLSKARESTVRGLFVSGKLSAFPWANAKVRFGRCRELALVASRRRRR